MNTITREYLQSLFDSHGTYKAIIQTLGMDPYAGGGYRTIKAYIKRYQIDLAKFEELQLMERSKKHLTLNFHNRKYTVSTVFQRATIKVAGDTLKKLMIESSNFEYKCSECPITDTHNGKPLSLQIDHIDGDCFNNEMDNLHFLCPNCHTQTSTYGSKNRIGKKIRGKTRTESWTFKEGKIVEKNRELVTLVQNSGINFSKFGWSKQVATVIDKPPQKVAMWMRKYMPDFLRERCFQKKKPQLRAGV